MLEILNILKQKFSLIASAFLKLFTPILSLLKCLACPVSEHPSTANVLTGPKHCTAEVCRRVLSSYLFIILTNMDLGTVPLIQI